MASVAALCVAACLMPWPRPSLSLEGSCVLARAGRFGVSCDLEQLSRDSESAWVRKSIRVYENGLPLREVGTSRSVRREGEGTYHTTGFLLTFSSLDGSDPRSNGRDYTLRSLRRLDQILLGSGPWRTVVVIALVASLAGLCLRFRSRAVPLLISTATAVSVACVSVQLLAVFTETPIHVDTGLFLPTAEAMAAGAIPHVDIDLGYTPLGLYELGYWGRVWPGPAPVPYNWYLALVIFNEVACAVLTFLIMRRVGVRAVLATATALSYLSMTIFFDGHRILLEPLYLVPVLVIAWLTLGPQTRPRLAAAGALAALAVLVKQYGGFGFWGLLGTTLVTGPARLRRAAFATLAFAVSGALLALILSAAGVNLWRLVDQTRGADYWKLYELVWLKRFLWYCPFAVVGVAVPFLHGAWARPGVRVLTCFLLAACLPFYFRQHQYYFLILCPWLFALFGVAVELAAASGSVWLRRAAVPLAAVLLVSVPLRAADAQAGLLDAEWRSKQYRRAWLMNRVWPEGKRTMILAYPYLYYIGRYRSADDAGVGYSFLLGCRGEQLQQAFAKAEGVWIDPKSMFLRGVERRLGQVGSSVELELAKNGFVRRLLLESRFELWTRG